MRHALLPCPKHKHFGSPFSRFTSWEIFRPETSGLFRRGLNDNGPGTFWAVLDLKLHGVTLF
jgi:hypothetical protein